MAANFGSSFAEAFLGTISAMDKHEQAKAEIAEAQRRNRIFDTYETAGNVLNGDDTSGLLDQKSYEKLQKQQAKEQRKAFKGGQKAQAPQMGALPTPQAGMQPTMATAPEPQMGAAPEPAPVAPAVEMGQPAPAPPSAPAPQAALPTPGAPAPTPTPAPQAALPAQGVPTPEAVPTQEQAPVAALPDGKEKLPVDAAKSGPTVKGPDNKEYYKVMVNGQVMYAPADRVKRLSGADLYKAQADALDRIDPVQAAALRKTVIGLEKDTIELNTARMSQSVAQAKAALMNGDYAGFAKSLASAYNTSVPDSMQVSIENDPQAGPVMVRTDVSGKVINKIPLNGIDPETKMRNVDMLMAQAETLTTPNGMTNWLKSVADMRSGVIGDALNLARKEQTELTTKQAKEMFPLEVAEKKARIKYTNRMGRGGSGSGGEGGFGSPSTIPIYGTDEDGNPKVTGNVVVRKGKNGRIEQLSTGFGNVYMPFGYDWDRVRDDMQSFANRVHSQTGAIIEVGVTKDGRPAYRNARTGKITPVSQDKLDKYRRK